MFRFGLFLLGVSLVLPSLASADNYGKGFCEGHMAGLVEAGTVVHAALDPVHKDPNRLPDDPLVRFLDTLFAVQPMVTFINPHMPYIVEHADGLRIQCPSGEILAPVIKNQKG